MIGGWFGANSSATTSEFENTASLAVTVDVGSVFAAGTVVQWRATVLGRGPTGLNPSPTAIGTATVSSVAPHSIAFTLPAINYGECVAVDVTLAKIPPLVAVQPNRSLSRLCIG